MARIHMGIEMKYDETKMGYHNIKVSKKSIKSKYEIEEVDKIEIEE